MKWIRFTIQTTTEAEDIIISDLYDIGLEGAQIEDKIPLTPLEKEQMFVDILPETEEDDGIAYLSFFVEAPEEASEKQALIEERKNAIAEALDGVRAYMEIGSGEITVSETEDLDWINNWRSPPGRMWSRRTRTR